MTNVTDIANEVSQVDEAVLKAFPFVSTMIGFVPGAQVAVPFLPLVQEFLQSIDNAAKAVSSGNPSAAATDILQEVINHLTPGKPNSPVLSG